MVHPARIDSLDSFDRDFHKQQETYPIGRTLEGHYIFDPIFQKGVRAISKAFEQAQRKYAVTGGNAIGAYTFDALYVSRALSLQRKTEDTDVIIDFMGDGEIEEILHKIVDGINPSEESAVYVHADRMFPEIRVVTPEQKNYFVHFMKIPEEKRNTPFGKARTKALENVQRHEVCNFGYTAAFKSPEDVLVSKADKVWAKLRPKDRYDVLLMKHFGPEVDLDKLDACADGWHKDMQATRDLKAVLQDRDY